MGPRDPHMNRPFALAERNVPRYTSYPTAPHFTAAVTPRLYRQWLEALPREATPLALYPRAVLHGALPLLRLQHARCAQARAGRCLCRAAAQGDRAARRCSPAAGSTHLHWGGGTPSILGPQWLETIAAQLASQFDLSALEGARDRARSAPVDQALVRTLAAIGVTAPVSACRTSRRDVQQLIGRVQPFALVERAADWLREAGIRDLNIDLMYGLPGQTAARCARAAPNSPRR